MAYVLHNLQAFVVLLALEIELLNSLHSLEENNNTHYRLDSEENTNTHYRLDSQENTNTQYRLDFEAIYLAGEFHFIGVTLSFSPIIVQEKITATNY